MRRHTTWESLEGGPWVCYINLEDVDETESLAWFHCYSLDGGWLGIGHHIVYGGCYGFHTDFCVCWPLFGNFQIWSWKWWPIPSQRHLVSGGGTKLPWYRKRETYHPSDPEIRSPKDCVTILSSVLFRVRNDSGTSHMSQCPVNNTVNQITVCSLPW